MVAAFNALLTSLDAKLPTSRFTADELRISNGRGRRSSRCKLHSLPRSPPLLRRSPRPRAFEFRSCAGTGMAQRTTEETKVEVNRDWRAMKHFRAALVIYYDVAWYLSPVGTTTLFERSSSSFIARPQHNGPTMFYHVLQPVLFFINKSLNKPRSRITRYKQCEMRL